MAIDADSYGSVADVAARVPQYTSPTLTYTSGSTEFTVGETLTGATSSTTAVVVAYTLDSGTWAGGDAAGTIYLSNLDGVFVSGENLNGSTGGNNIATAGTLTQAGSFHAGTQPTLAQVEAFIDDTSSLMNALLKGAGFTIPITAAMASQADHAVRTLDMWLADAVAEQVEGVNRAGRFTPGAAELRGGRTVSEEIALAFARWLNGDPETGMGGHADDLEDLGAQRTAGVAQAAGVRETRDDSSVISDKIPFSLEQFDNERFDWDPD